MKLDLRKDRKSLLKYIKARIRDYPVYVNEGPGRDQDDITQITLGYQFDQAGWAALVFDTRAEAAVDGEWQSYIEENEFELPIWCDVYERLYEKGWSVALTRPDGGTGSLDSDDNLAEVIGECLRDLLVDCRDDGLFDKLPLAANCRLSIEEHEGQYAWTQGDDDSEDEESEDPFAVPDELKARVGKLAKAKQIAFWIDRLKQIAADKKRDPEDFEFTVHGNVDALAEIGADAVGPMLKLALSLAAKPAYVTEAGERREYYHSNVLDCLIHKVDDLEHRSPEIEKLLRQIVTKAVKANTGKELWGAAAFFAARTLHNLFDNYPCPDLGDDDNSLVDPKPFLGAKKK